MLCEPRTPSKEPTTRSPLTHSLNRAFNALSLNKTVTKHSPNAKTPTPKKRSPTTSDAKINANMKKDAGKGVIRKGGIESKLQVVIHDYPAPTNDRRGGKSENRFTIQRDARCDRYIPNRYLETAPIRIKPGKSTITTSPGHTARLAEATGLHDGCRILRYRELPPTPTPDTAMTDMRLHARMLYHRNRGHEIGKSSGTGPKARYIPGQAERILDAPGLVDDYYLNLVSWSCENLVAVGLGDNAYTWNSQSGAVTRLGQAAEGSYISSVEWSQDGMYLGVGNGSGEVQVWDAESKTKLRTMSGHHAQVAVLSWNNHVLSSGCGDGSIWHHDVRIARHKVMELLGHTGEVCGLKWRSDGAMIASGGNDNAVNIWDGRGVNTTGRSRATPIWTKRNHTAAVKAIGWSPWQNSLLATGGGTSDAAVHFWNSVTGAKIRTLQTPSQVTSVIFAPNSKEVFTTHGYPTNSIMIHSYPLFGKIADIRGAHDSRVLFSALGPNGDLVCTGAGDETLKFWSVLEKLKEGNRQLVLGIR